MGCGNPSMRAPLLSQKFSPLWLESQGRSLSIISPFHATDLLNGLVSVIQCRFCPATTPSELAFSHVASPNQDIRLFSGEFPYTSVNRCWMNEASSRLLDRRHPSGRDRPRRARLKSDCWQESFRSGRTRSCQIWKYVVGCEGSTMDWSSKGSQSAGMVDAAVDHIFGFRSVGVMVLNADLVRARQLIGPRLRSDFFCWKTESPMEHAWFRAVVRPGLLGASAHGSRRFAQASSIRKPKPNFKLGHADLRPSWPILGWGDVLIWYWAHYWALSFNPGLLGFYIWDPGDSVGRFYEYFCINESDGIIGSSGVVLKEDSIYYAGQTLANEWIRLVLSTNGSRRVFNSHSCTNEWIMRHLPLWVLPQRLVLSFDGSGWVFNGHSGFKLAFLSHKFTLPYVMWSYPDMLVSKLYFLSFISFFINLFVIMLVFKPDVILYDPHHPV